MNTKPVISTEDIRFDPRKPFSELSRQRRYQLRKTAEGRCSTCGGPMDCSGVRCNNCKRPTVGSKLGRKPRFNLGLPQGAGVKKPKTAESALVIKGANRKKTIKDRYMELLRKSKAKS